jgi:hypothetical protein
VWLNSTASLRDSPTLKGGWREVYDFDVYFGRKGSSDTALQVDGILRPMVARQAIGNLASYHGLDDAQRSAYLSVFDDLVGNSLRAACGSASQIDATNIKCQK